MVCRPLWVLNLCLITVANSSCLNPVMHYRTTRHQVYSQIKHISADSKSLSYCLQSYQLTPKCCRPLWYASTYRILGGFAVIGLAYTVVYVSSVFLKLPAGRQTSTDGSLCCIVTSLPWYFRLAFSHRDLAADSSRYLLTRLLPLLCSVPFLPKCCMVSTWPSERLPFAF